MAQQSRGEVQSYESTMRPIGQVRGGPLPPRGLPPLIQGKGGKFLHAAGAVIHTERICFTSRKNHFEILHIPEWCCWVSQLLIPFAYKLAALHRRSWRDSLAKIADHANGTQERMKGGNSSKRVHHLRFYPKKARPVPHALGFRFMTQQLCFPRNKTSPVTYFHPAALATNIRHVSTSTAEEPAAL